MTFDPTKPVQTRDGQKAEILRYDLNNEDWPIVAVITRPDGQQWAGTFGSGGRYSTYNEREYDLVNVPEKARVWVQIFRNEFAQDGWSFAASRKEPSGFRDTIVTECVEAELPEDGDA